MLVRSRCTETPLTQPRRSMLRSRLFVDGECVVIYPEGTLTRDLALWPMRGKSGAARVGLATGCPVVPVAHWGAQEILARGQRAPRLFPRRTVTVQAGAPVDLARFREQETTPEALRAATAAIMDSVVTLLAEVRQTSAPPRDGVGEEAPDRDGVG